MFTTMASQRRPSNSSVLVTCLKAKWRDFVPFCHHSACLSKAPAWRGRHDCATGCNYRSQKLGRMIHLTVVKVMISIWFEATIQIRQRDCHLVYPVYPPQPQPLSTVRFFSRASFSRLIQSQQHLQGPMTYTSIMINPMKVGKTHWFSKISWLMRFFWSKGSLDSLGVLTRWYFLRHEFFSDRTQARVGGAGLEFFWQWSFWSIFSAVARTNQIWLCLKILLDLLG